MTAHRIRLRRRPLIAMIAGIAATASIAGVGIMSVVTDAAYTDQANVNLTAGNGQGIGVKQNFDIALVGRDGTMAQGLASAPATLAIDPAVTGDLAPGRSVTTTVAAFNNTPRWQAGVALALSSASGSGMLGHLRFTAVDTATGATVFGNAADPTKGVSIADANAAIGRTLAGSGKIPLTPGQSASGIPGAARADITLTIAYLDDLTAAEKVSLNGATVPLTVTFTAEKI